MCVEKMYRERLFFFSVNVLLVAQNKAGVAAQAATPANVDELAAQAVLNKLSVNPVTRKPKPNPVERHFLLKVPFAFTVVR